MTRQTRTVVAIATGVLLLHIGALWALHHGLTARAPAVTPPVPLLARLVAPPAPTPRPAPVPAPTRATAAQPAPPAPRPPPPEPRPAPVKPAAAATQAQASPPPAAPRPVPRPPVPTPAPVVAEPTPLPATPVPAAAADKAAPVTNHAMAANTSRAAPPEPSAASGGPPSGAVAVAPAGPSAPPPLELPSSDASYLQNPRPRYPPISLRLREQGTVLVDVLVSDQGLARKAKVKTSSGFFRLDNAAVATVLTWRFVPGKRAGVAQTMWFTVPIVFQIQ